MEFKNKDFTCQIFTNCSLQRNSNSIPLQRSFYIAITFGQFKAFGKFLLGPVYMEPG